MPTAVSLFSGCGGSDAGIIKLGFDIIMANDLLPYAKDVYLANHPNTHYVLENIEHIQSFPKADLLIGCYPCQGFSQGGVRNPDRKINKLYHEFARALKDIQPKAFIVENVSGMVRKNFRHLLEDQIKTFSQAGYAVEVEVLNAVNFGVPQERKRIFIVGIRLDFGCKYIFPAPTHGDTGLPIVTIHEAIGDMAEWPEGEFYDNGFHWYYLSRNRRRDWWQASKTIVANPRHTPLHPMSPPLKKIGEDKWQFINSERARRFSYKEAARLQGFIDFVFPETKASSLNAKYTVIGNAVPPPLFEAVALALPNIW